MRMTINTILSKTTERDFFRKLYLFLCLLYFMPSTFNIERYPLFIMMAWGMLLVLQDIIKEKIFFNNKYWKILAGVILIYAFSIISNYDHALVRGVYNLIFLVINFVVIFPISMVRSKEFILKRLKEFNEILIITIFIGGTISLVMFFFNIGLYLPTNGLRQGFLENRLFGIYSSPNVGSVFGYITIMASLVNNLLKRNSLFKFSTFYIINLIVQILYFILASSRGTTMILISATVMFFSFIILPITIKKYDNKRISFGIVFLLLIGFLSTSQFTLNTVKSGLSYVPGFVESVLPEEENKKMASKEEYEEKVIIQHSPENAEVSSGRYSIWKAALNVVKQYPLFGVTDPDLYRNTESTDVINESRLSKIDIKELKRAAGNMHNVYMQILITTGIVGFVALAYFLIWYLIDISKYIFYLDKYSKEYQIVTLLFITSISFFIGDLVESRLVFMNRNVVGIVFWYFAGIILYFKNQNSISDKQNF